MAVSTVSIGRGATEQEGGFAEIASGQVRASVFDPTGQNLWGHTFSLIAGRNGVVSPNFRVGAWTANSNREPDTRLGYSSEKIASTLMSSWDGGSYLTAGVAIADDSPTNAAIAIPSGTRVAIGPLPDADLGIGMKEAAFLPGADELRLFNRSGLTPTTPPDPFGSFTSSIEGHLTIALICDSNDPPVVPVNRTADTSTGTLTPTFEADHRDRNGPYGVGNGGADRGDYLRSYRLQLRRQSDGVLLWNPAPYTASGAERTNNRFSRLYVGVTLVAGTPYEWRAQTTDHFGEASPWTDWLAYTPPAAGSVTVTAPTGKQLTTSPSPFAFTWHHATGLATQNVTVRIKQSSVVIRTSAAIAKIVADAASSSVTWAETGFAALPWGGSCTTEMRGQDSGGNESPWSAGLAFTTDIAPGVPVILAPMNGAVVTSLPLVRIHTGDADDNDNGLTVKLLVMNAAGTVLQTRTMTHTGETGLGDYRYQTIAADLPSFADYQFAAYSFDGTLYSGETTVEASAEASDHVTVTYAQGPTPSISSPADSATITTSTPTISWTVSQQSKYRLRVFPAGSGTALFTGAWVVDSVARSVAVPGALLVNGQSYDLEIGVEDSNQLQGFDTATSVLLQYVAPAALTGFAVDAVAIGTDPWPTTIRGEWEQSSDLDFVKYRVYRDDLSVPFWEGTSALVTSVYDYSPVSGRAYTFSLVQVVLRDGAAEVESAPVMASATVNLGGVVLQSATDPDAYRAILTSVQDRTVTPAGEEAMYLTWAGGAPVSFRGRVRYQTLQMTARIKADDQASAGQRQADLEAVEAFGGVILYRDERGRKLYGKLPPNTLTTHDVRVIRSDVDLTIREEQFSEGVVS